MSSGNLSVDELYARANEMARKHWGVDFTGTIVLVPYRWRSRLAAFRFKPVDPTFQEIRMSAKVNATLTKEQVLDNLLHELVHWRLYTLGRPFDDTDEEFIRECERVGASLSEATAAQKAYQRYITREARKLG